MPKPRKSGKPKNGLRKVGRALKKRYQVYKPAAVQLYRDVKYLKDVINIEYKAKDTIISGLPDTAGEIFNLCLVGQGDDYAQRVGRSIKIHSLSVRTLNFVGTNPNTVVRMMIFKTRENQATAPAISDVLQRSPYTYTHYNKFANNQESFTVMYDRVFRFDEAGVGHMEFELPVGTHMKFSGAGSTEADTGNGCLYMLLVSNCSAAAEPTISAETRVIYTDD